MDRCKLSRTCSHNTGKRLFGWMNIASGARTYRARSSPPQRDYSFLAKRCFGPQAILPVPSTPPLGQRERKTKEAFRQRRLQSVWVRKMVGIATPRWGGQPYPGLGLLVRTMADCDSDVRSCDTTC